MRRRLIAVASLASVGAACSLFTPLEGYREDIVVVVEAGAADIGADGGAEASGRPFCQTLSPAPFFCSDFDDGLLPGPWTGVVSKNGGAIAVDQGALLVSIPATGDTSSEAYLYRALPGTRTELDIEVDLLVEQTGAPSFDLLMVFPDDVHEVAVEINDGALTLDEDRPDPSGSGTIEVKTPLGAGLPTSWAHIRWSLRATGGAATSEVFVNGTSTGPVSIDPVDFTGPCQLEIGESYSKLTAPLRVRYDNVVIRTK